MEQVYMKKTCNFQKQNTFCKTHLKNHESNTTCQWKYRSHQGRGVFIGTGTQCQLHALSSFYWYIFIFSVIII